MLCLGFPRRLLTCIDCCHLAQHLLESSPLRVRARHCCTAVLQVTFLMHRNATAIHRPVRFRWCSSPFIRMASIATSLQAVHTWDFPFSKSDFVAHHSLRLSYTVVWCLVVHFAMLFWPARASLCTSMMEVFLHEVVRCLDCHVCSNEAKSRNIASKVLLAARFRRSWIGSEHP